MRKDKETKKYDTCPNITATKSLLSLILVKESQQEMPLQLGG
jgi:hypothetical protein